MKSFYAGCILLLCIQTTHAQSWTNLGSNEATRTPIVQTDAFTFFTALSANGTLYTSYIDDGFGPNNLGDFKVHARRYTGGQWVSAGDAISAAFPASDYFPIACDGNVPYVAYSEPLNAGNNAQKITVKKLNSNTNQWELLGQQAFSAGAASFTAIAAAGGKVYVAYEDDSLRVKYFDTTNIAGGWRPLAGSVGANTSVIALTIAVDNNIPYIAYSQAGNDTLFVKKYNGSTWVNVATNTIANNFEGVAFGGARPTLRFNNNHRLCTAYLDTAATSHLLYLDANNTWQPIGTQPATTTATTNVTFTPLRNTFFQAFGQPSPTFWQGFVKRLRTSDSSWADAGTPPVTASPNPVSITGFSMECDGNNTVFLVFHNTSGELFAKSFDASAILLPVTLTRFTATAQEKNVLLEWATVNEIDNSLFEVEYSVDGQTFSTIGTVTAANVTSNQEQQYSFTDASPARGINYYRLKQIDKSNHFSYSKLVAVLFNGEKQSSVTLFPNPAKTVLHVSNTPAGTKKIIIYNTAGKLIKQLITSDKWIDISVADLPRGMYYLSFYGEALIETKTFSKL